MADQNSFVDSLFSSVNEIAYSTSGRVKDSIDWLVYQARNLLSSNITETQLRTADPQKGQGVVVKRINDRKAIGRMFMFVYDPKTKDKLPYYDTLPLILLVAPLRDGFYGLNLHYVPPFVRAKILEALAKNLNRSNLTENSKARLSYSILQRSSRFNLIKPCFKRYLYTHVRSGFMYIDPLDWDKAIMLPTERFKKAGKAQVFRDFVSRDLGKNR